MLHFRFYTSRRTSELLLAKALLFIPDFSRTTRMASNFVTEERGKVYTESYRLYFKNGANQVISPFHDIPLKAVTTETEDESSTCLFNMVVEVPKWSNAKMEISKSQPMNPIMQDVKKGKVRFVGNVFPHRGYIWNYGAFPQTWEDPNTTYSETGTKGDNDPLDVCDISNIVSPRGTVIQVKVLGVLLMIDEGETDWKVMAINSEDPLAQHMQDITDVEKYKPGLLHATIEWFKYYKVPDGKPTNAFGFNNKFKNRQFALDVITETNHQWNKLLTTPQTDESEDVGISRSSITVNESPFLVTCEQSQTYLDTEPEYDLEPAPIEDMKAFDSFFINAAAIPTVEQAQTTDFDECRDTVESASEIVAAAVDVVENGEESEAAEVEVAENGGDVAATESEAAEAEAPVEETAAAEPAAEGEDEEKEASPANPPEAVNGGGDIENGVATAADGEGVPSGHTEDSAVTSEEAAPATEQTLAETTGDDVVKDKPVEQAVEEGAFEEISGAEESK